MFLCEIEKSLSLSFLLVCVVLCSSFVPLLFGCTRVNVLAFFINTESVVMYIYFHCMYVFVYMMRV